MVRFVLAFAIGLTFFRTPSFAQETFVVTGTQIPPGLLQKNYGRVPKGVGAYDLSICNVSDVKQSVVGSEIYQALAKTETGLQPIGKQIMLAAILSNQSHSSANIWSVAVNSVSGLFSILGSSRYRLPAGIITAAAIGSLSSQQLLASLKPLLSPDQVEKFEAQVLEPALVLDSGSCVERTVFTLSASAKNNSQSLSFHVR